MHVFLQLFSALKNAFSVILKFLDFLSKQVLSKEPNRLDDFDLKHFVCATIRVLGAWLSEETATMREEVLAINSGYTGSELSFDYVMF